MSSIDFDFDFDTQLYHLELEWRRAFEAGIAAVAEYHALAENPTVSARTLDDAREIVERAEALKTKIMTKIERLDVRVSRRI